MRPSSNVSLRFLPVFAEDCVNRHINSVASNKARGSQLFIMVRWFVGPFLLWNKSDLMPRLLRRRGLNPGKEEELVNLLWAITTNLSLLGLVMEVHDFGHCGSL